MAEKLLFAGMCGFAQTAGGALRILSALVGLGRVGRLPYRRQVLLFLDISTKAKSDHARRYFVLEGGPVQASQVQMLSETTTAIHAPSAGKLTKREERRLILEAEALAGRVRNARHRAAQAAMRTPFMLIDRAGFKVLADAMNLSESDLNHWLAHHYPRDYDRLLLGRLFSLEEARQESAPEVA